MTGQMTCQSRVRSRRDHESHSHRGIELRGGQTYARLVRWASLACGSEGGSGGEGGSGELACRAACCRCCAQRGWLSADNTKLLLPAASFAIYYGLLKHVPRLNAEVARYYVSRLTQELPGTSLEFVIYI